MRSDGQNNFPQWWNSLTVPGAVDGHTISREAAKAVWEHARAFYQAKMDFLLDNLEASAYLANTLPLEDQAFIADQFHGGLLTYRVQDRVDWHAKPKQIVRAFDSRTNLVTISVQPHSGHSRRNTSRQRR